MMKFMTMSSLYRRKYFLSVTFILFSILHIPVLSFDRNSTDANVREEFEVNVNEDLINVTGLILARGGSKGIPKKNLAIFKGQTLLRRAILTMKEFGGFSSIWVSTDNRDIAEVAESSGAYVHYRSAESATDTASSLMAIQEFSKRKPGISYIGLVQCTSPFLTSSYLREAYTLLSRGFDSVFSGTREHKLRWKELAGGEVVPLNFDRRSRPRRQDWKGDLVENGMFYFMNIGLINSGILQGGRIGVVEIPKDFSIEIDDPKDLVIAEVLYDTHLTKM